MKVEDVNSAKELPIMEYFYTIQGEGYHSGRAAYFIRIAGCDVGCVWCDVKESWELNDHPIQRIDDIVTRVIDSGTDFCVITGGEPTMYDLTVLTDKLKAASIDIAIETSGCYQLHGHIDWYCFSPKKFKPPIEQAYRVANELKIIISHPSDFEWAESHAKKVNSNTLLYLQPEWSKQERFLPLIIDYVKKHPKWCISLQTHKFMNIP
ncbi:MAG: 7-carboxy-7-deazaguanine synthase QueE [Crocinitomicaceae bacterium]|nr:7-carboxy-7-deazaguanine synthase QueE [Crocinitomicaceae bacterium]MDG1657277.1 7-carboxy-7-deazaguanine synthase QueE [Crocinitomicaceae bacterium]MDG2441518.1 7-carboxy-7-deazaguanine synthase QueE [Crocinitomicaceae bacterium]